MGEKVVYLGMSGGVDSSVAALLLREQGYKVVGVYMKNWSRDLPGMKCPWARDLADAKRVAVKLGLEFRVFDFEKEYKQRVVDYMLAEYQKGNTPNPDIMCNQEVKFKLFAETAFAEGADYIATGHYATVKDGDLCMAKDKNKDQTYFLYRASSEVLGRTLFPIGGLLKPEVKEIARRHGLHTASKKESMGVCFVGRAGIREFLGQYVEGRAGEIRDAETDEVLGTHDGAIFYTLGQRHGMDVGGGLPYYVVRKDMDRNVVYVSRDLNARELWASELELKDVVLKKKLVQVFVRLRHRAPLVPAVLDGGVIRFDEAVRRPAAGQSAVFYDGDVCVGGGVIS